MKRSLVVVLVLMVAIASLSFLIVRRNKTVELDRTVSEAKLAFGPVANGVWPIKPGQDGTGYFLRCFSSREKFHYEDVFIENGYRIKAWAECTYEDADGNTEYVSVPLYVEDNTANEYFILHAIEPNKYSSEGFTPTALSVMFANNQYFSNIDMNNIQAFGVLFGAAQPGSQGYYKITSKLVNAVGEENISKFAETGNAEHLKNFGPIKHLLPVYKINIDLKPIE